MGLGNVQKVGGPRRQSRDNKTVDIPLIAVDYKLAEGTTPNKGDIMVVGLVEDAFGLKAEFDADGNPTTLLDLRLNYFEKNPDRAKSLNVEKRTNVRDFLAGKDGKDKVKRGGGYVMIAEGCYLEESTNTIVSRYLTRGSQAMNSETHKVLHGKPVSVRRAGQRERDGEMNYFQPRLHPFVGENETLVLSGTPAFQKDAVGTMQAAIASAFDQLSAVAEKGDLLGSYGLIVRAVGLTDGKLEAIHREVRPIWDREAKAQKPGAESAAEFMASEAGQGILEALQSTNEDENVFWEIVPYQSLRTGARSTPQARNADRVLNKAEPLALDHRSISDNAPFYYRDEADGSTESGFATATSYVRRTFNDVTEKWGGWFVTKTVPVEGQYNARVYAPAELITHALLTAKPEMAAAIEAQVDDRTAKKRAASKSKSGPEASEPEASEPEAGKGYSGF